MTITTTRHAENLRNEGFTIVPSVLSKAEVRGYRDRLTRIFDNSRLDPALGDMDRVRSDVMSRYEAFADIFFRDAVLTPVRSLLGERFVILPETSITDSQYGGWHTDTTSWELAGQTFRNAPDFSLVNVAFYFQENGIYGGGLDVVPGSHREQDVFLEQTRLKNEAHKQQAALRAQHGEKHARLKSMIPEPVLRFRRKFAPKQEIAVPQKSASTQAGQHTIAQQPGDLVVFDLRLYHKASWPEAPQPFPPEARKYSFFVICGGDNETTRKYRDYLLMRAETEKAYAYLKDLRYPDRLTRRAQDAGVILL